MLGDSTPLELAADYLGCNSTVGPFRLARELGEGDQRQVCPQGKVASQLTLELWRPSIKVNLVPIPKKGAITVPVSMTTDRKSVV